MKTEKEIKKEKTIEIKDYLGNAGILRLPKTAFFCSRRVPASAVLPCYNWAIAQRNSGQCIISGFHSLIEKDVFHFLARGRQPLVLVHHKGLNHKWDEQTEKLLREGRLLILSPFERNVAQGTEARALLRNRLALQLADEVKIGYAGAGGNVARLFQEESEFPFPG